MLELGKRSTDEKKIILGVKNYSVGLKKIKGSADLSLQFELRKMVKHSPQLMKRLNIIDGCRTHDDDCRLLFGRKQ